MLFYVICKNYVPDHLVQYLVFHHPKPKEQATAAALMAKYNELPKKTGPKKRGSTGDPPAGKRPRYDSKLKGADSMSSMFVDEIEYKAPENLQTILAEVFNKFWDLEVAPAISTPFFALITRHNCGPVFGMPEYFDKVTDACTLANIKVYF
jgi:hypothetical protein